MSVGQWAAARVHYYSQDRDALVLRAVAPLLRWLEDRSVPSYFAPHWRLGPHLRIAVAPRTGSEDLLAHGVQTFVEPFLLNEPSTARIDPDALRTVHEQLAWDEQVLEPLHPLAPDNSVHFGVEDDRSGVVGTEFAGLVRDFDVAAWKHSVDSYRLVEAGRSKFSLAFDLLASTALIATPERHDPVSGFGSMRMQAERLVVTASDPVRVRQHCESLYDRLRPALIRRLRSIVDGVPDGDIAGLRWTSLIEPRRDEATALHRRGVRMPMASADPATWGRYAESVRASPLHMATMGDPAQLERLSRCDWHQGYRFAVNLCYLQLTRLGITASQRLQVCYLLSRTATDVIGTLTSPDRVGA
ncbi:lantibiotic dehydratase C-terminal domain-containing protein [Lentzea sp. HUAS12]|uniref:lantibiotic dehydratase C-terminal domain-containing protein n=1 Tax=Lentzea sp. HUAS12 TaxID=2951806 RepID=UPI00209D5F13|nr:lantibiotic dehydratase C-terminal domain-containing protein [Lentzea sp. HUAS12]USX56356.1 hypothetical protein ND450_20315 [Lentzea sp. HUAS12]